MPDTNLQSESKPASVFVVEDEGIIASSISDSLRKAGYEVAGIARSGEETLLKLSGITPQLILMDIHLSGRMDGIELAGKIRETFDIPIVYLTAHSDRETLNRAKITEPFGYLPKPVQQSNLYTAIEIALYKHRVDYELRQNRASLNTVLGSMHDGVLVVDNAGIVQFINAHAERLTCWPACEAIGQPVSSVLPLTDKNLEVSVDKLLTGTLGQHWPKALPPGLLATDREGNTFPLDGDIATSTDALGSVGTVITFRSAAERLKHEQDIRHDHKMLAVGRLAAGVAHDFNNLLTVVLGTAEIALAQLPPGHELCGSIQQIIQAGETAADVTRKLLTFSSKQVTPARVVDWNSIIRSHEGLCRHLLGPHITWSMTLGAKSGLVRADPAELAEVLINLVTNARDAMPEGGHLTIQTADVDLEAVPLLVPQTNGYVALIVEDTGRGMDASTAEHLFEPFFTTKLSGKGTGLGLSIVDGIVRELGGSIDVDSEPGLGTTFRVYLPCVSGFVQTPAPTFQKPLPPREKVLLVVDDDHAVRRVIVTALDGHGYRVLEAESGKQAFEIAKEQAGGIDLLISDVMMPGMNGPDLSLKIQSLYPGVKTMFVSGFSGDLLKEHDLNPAEVCLLRKPFRQAQLLAKIQTMLGSLKSIAQHSA